MSRPFVSCLMPTYNRGWRDPLTVGEAVYWFLRQDYTGPRELVVLVDAPGAFLHLELSEPLPVGCDVRVVNYNRRFPNLAEKFDECVKLAAGSILMPWEDDDISLPHRISQTVEELEHCHYWNPKGAFFQNGKAAPLTLCSPDSVHHNASGFTRMAWATVGGYAATAGWGNKQDAWFDRELRRKVDTREGRLTPERMSYVYRWGFSDKFLHLSGHSNPDAGWKAEPEPSGDTVVIPAMLRDYEAEANSYVQDGRRKRAE